jgi:DNA-3-methyladenine glycosylase I
MATDPAEPDAPGDHLTRCDWAGTGRMRDYHDREWGTPTHDDRELFEFLVLEGAQAGLSWRSVLDRRDGYRRVFRGFDPAAVAAMGEVDQARALADDGIIRNRAKVASTVTNAVAFLAVQAERGSFDDYLWAWVDGVPRVNRWVSTGQLPASTPLSEALSRDLRRRGFRFVGPTICYAYLQAAGLVMDHVTSCFRYEQLSG